MTDLYKQFIDYISSIDSSSKNIIIRGISNLYDMETIQGVRNSYGDIDSYWINKK